MSQTQANCPHCGTSFTVSDEQLRVANGHVRCGVCMKVFKAADTVSEVAAPAPQPVSPTPAPAVKDSFSSMDDDASIEEWIKKNQKTGNANIQSGLVTAPENLSKENLSFEDEISDAFEQLKPVRTSQNEKKEEAKPQAKKPAPKQAPIEPKPTPSFAGKLDEDDTIEDELSDLVTRGHDPVHPTQIGQKKDENDNMDNAFGIGFDDVDDDPFGFHHEPVVQVALGSKEIEEPITLESRLPFFFWPSLTLVFSLMLFAQVLIKNFDELAIDPGYRAFYANFCAAGLCTLPALKDVTQIRGSNLVVRPHPNQPGALIIDAMINNQAPFDQDFPTLYLSFSNIQGKVIASRAFKPEEYLQGELKSLKNMPSKTPLHLSLELLDPGKEAINYHIDFLENS